MITTGKVQPIRLQSVHQSSQYKAGANICAQIGSHFTKSDSDTIMLGLTITLKSGVRPVAIIHTNFGVIETPHF